MDSQTEVYIFRLEIFPSFWRMRHREAPPTTVPHPRGKHYSLDWTWILDWTGLWTGLIDYGSILH